MLICESSVTRQINSGFRALKSLKQFPGFATMELWPSARSLDTPQCQLQVIPNSLSKVRVVCLSLSRLENPEHVTGSGFCRMSIYRVRSARISHVQAHVCVLQRLFELPSSSVNLWRDLNSPHLHFHTFIRRSYYTYTPGHETPNTRCLDHFAPVNLRYLKTQYFLTHPTISGPH